MAQGSGSEKMKWEKVGIDTISTLILVESAGSFGDGHCCHPSGYLQIALSLPPSPSPKSLRRFHQTNRVNGMSPDHTPEKRVGEPLKHSKEPQSDPLRNR
jgi:hypothetical protein